MDVASGTRLGPYEIVGMIGRGGMGEVYRARDTRLDRTVAVKVLSSEFSADAERRLRLQREARAISSVAHPHICALLDLGNHEGVDYLVLEYLEGETLQARLAQGPMPIDQVLRYGRELADALATAHRTGIVHRDLKPGNVMLTKSGAKLLDFGLAKSVGPVAGTDQNLETQSQPLTQPGAVFGTWPYMAPELLQGKEAGPLSDLFALGAVLFEMASGKPAFAGDTAASLIAAILRHDPPAISTLRKDTPIALEQLIKSCLEKSPEDRWQSAQDAGAELQWMAESSRHPPSAASPARRRLVWPAIASLLGVLLLLAVAALIHWRAQPSHPPLLRLSLVAPDNASFQQIALSPDGSTLAFVATGADGRPRLWVRRLDSNAPQLLPGTEDATRPFWSPDSRSIAFYSLDVLKRVEAAGGAPEILCTIPHARDSSWGPGNTMLVSHDAYQPINLLTPGDCSLKAVTALSVTGRDIGNTEAQFLPDGHHFLWVENHLAPRRTLDILVSDSDSPDPKTPASQLLIHNGSMPSYVPGYILFNREGKLLAQAFDVKSLRTLAEPFAVLPERVRSNHLGGSAVYSAAINGVLVYAPEVEVSNQLHWQDRSGHASPPIAEPGSNRLVQISAAGNQALVARESSETQLGDLWVYKVVQSGGVAPPPSRFTFSPMPTEDGRWADADHVLYVDQRSGVFTLHRKRVNGAESDEPLLQSDRWLAPCTVSPDGDFLIYQTFDAVNGFDLSLLPLTGDRKPVPFLRTPFNEGGASFSPDGRWVAYASDKSGKVEIYVRPFPGPGAEVQVSSGTAAAVDGGAPMAMQWRGDGKELFYLSDSWNVMAAPLTYTQEIRGGAPISLFSLRPGSEFAATGDGQHFLINAPVHSADTTSLNVVVNWLSGLNKK